MLEGLDKIEWDKLGHAYGPAGDVPDLIRDLASPDEDARDDAWHDLYGNIWHQGTVYEATAYAVPFFIELLEAREVQGKDQILAYLAHLSQGTSYKAVHSRLPLYEKLYGEEMKTAKWQNDLQTELSWVERATLAVQAGQPVYLGLLADPDAPTRDSAAFLLAKLDGTNGKIREQIERRLEIEGDATVQVSLLLALGKMCQYNEASHALLSSFIDSAHPKPVTLAANIALAALAPEHITQEMINAFVEAIQNAGGYTEFEESVWADGDSIVAYISRKLHFQPGVRLEAMEYALLQALKVENMSQAQAVAEALLNLVFHGPVKKGAPFTSLAPEEQRVLGAFVEAKHLWGFQSDKDFVEDVTTMGLMRARNLPDRLAKLSAFVRGEEIPQTPPPKAVKSGGTVARVIKNLGKIIKFP